MNVILLTVFVTVVLVGFFVFLFVQQFTRTNDSSERNALMPLEEEQVRPANRPAPDSPSRTASIPTKT